MRILYITFDGVLEPLGYAQVVRVVAALARRGYPYVLLSLEKADCLADTERVASTRRALDAAGVPWIVVPYAGGSSARAAAQNVARAVVESARAVRRFNVKLVHARAYHAATVALALRRALGVSYLFDARSYWIDERAEEGRWFVRERAYRTGKAVERALYNHAAGIVSLTKIQADDLRGGAMEISPRDASRSSPPSRTSTRSGSSADPSRPLKSPRCCGARRCSGGWARSTCRIFRKPP